MGTRGASPWSACFHTAVQSLLAAPRCVDPVLRIYGRRALQRRLGVLSRKSLTCRGVATRTGPENECRTAYGGLMRRSALLLGVGSP